MKEHNDSNCFQIADTVVVVVIAILGIEWIGITDSHFKNFQILILLITNNNKNSIYSLLNVHDHKTLERCQEAWYEIKS